MAVIPGSFSSRMCANDESNSSFSLNSSMKDEPNLRRYVRHSQIALLLFYILATSKGIPVWVLTCDSVHSWWLYSAAPLGDQATNTMT